MRPCLQLWKAEAKCLSATGVEGEVDSTARKKIYRCFLLGYTHTWSILAQIFPWAVAQVALVSWLRPCMCV
ncbi:hypothetical protein RchiOBHm_Chr1g0331661 [Rosa chinensis]|uniref:Uncharacterized protein n=1 Tax=Rosa chinensis TaxID=74649 RepID=A0A2P6SBL4_ROSCH|nr:hypothetical protein RchiOBHm_Chr1g0331661 [Rosa chinensis]